MCSFLFLVYIPHIISTWGLNSHCVPDYSGSLWVLVYEDYGANDICLLFSSLPLKRRAWLRREGLSVIIYPCLLPYPRLITVVTTIDL